MRLWRRKGDDIPKGAQIKRPLQAVETPQGLITREGDQLACAHLDGERIAWGLIAHAATGWDKLLAVNDKLVPPQTCPACREAVTTALVVAAITCASQFSSAPDDVARRILEGVAHHVALGMAAR